MSNLPGHPYQQEPTLHTAILSSKLTDICELFLLLLLTSEPVSDITIELDL